MIGGDYFLINLRESNIFGRLDNICKQSGKKVDKEDNDSKVRK